jgi:GT2 family glycosyltransferase
MVDLSVVIVNWNVCQLLRRCLASLVQSEGLPTNSGSDSSVDAVEIIVVDNGSTDDSVQMVHDEFPAVRLIENRANLGFARANNLGIAETHGRYVLLLNPDAEVASGTLATMLAFADAHPDIGLIGPQLINADGSVQSSRRRFPTIATAVFESTWLEPWAPSRILDRYYVRDRRDNVTQDVDWVQGAALFVRRDVIEQVGGMDEQFFMYSEELDWCRQIKDAGWRIVYYPEAQVVHHGGKSSDQVVAARHIYFQTSKVLYFRKYHGAWVGELLRLFLLENYTWQLAVESVKWLIGHRRELRRERIMAYRELLRSGLRARNRP